MKKKSVYYFLGDSYSRDILPYLKVKYRNIYFQEKLSVNVDWVLLSPTVDNRAKNFLNTIKLNKPIALLLDWNYLGFEDYHPLIETGRIKLVLSPFPVRNCRWYKISSPHAKMIKERVIFESVLNHDDLFFCSQPLKEDRPYLGFNQYDLLRKVIKIAEERKVSVFLKRHPREEAEIPEEFKDFKNLRLWEESLESAMGKFTNWYGYNTIALYDARALGHKVNFLQLQTDI